MGVVHRDIKPENIIMSGNHALVLDFGVARALSSATAETPAQGPTLTSLGIALGTPAYMAPEQAVADPNVDARADIYALGIVGYELLAGRTPFAGMNQQQMLSAHVVQKPDNVTQYRPQIPPGLAAVIMRAIEKHPSDRFQNAGDMHDALEPYSVTSGATAPTLAIPSAKKPFTWTPQRIAVVAGIAGVVVMGFIASTFAFRKDSPALIIGETKQVTNANGLEVWPSISPDGKTIAYATSSKAGFQIFVRQISGGRAIPLTDSTIDAEMPKWSPDGSRIIYTSGVRSFTIPAFGGIATPVGDTLAHYSACAWSNSGDRLACSNEITRGIVIAGANGESPKVIPNTVGNNGAYAPVWSADDRLIAFVRSNPNYFFGSSIGNIAPSSVWVARVDGGEPVRITEDLHLNTSPVFTPEGAILYVSSLKGNRDVYLQKIGSDLEPRGEPTRLTTGLNAHTITLDKTGSTLVYSVFTPTSNVWAAPIKGHGAGLHQITTGTQTIEFVSISHDGKWILYDSNLNGNQDIYKQAIAGGDPEQLTHNNADNFNAVFSPDDKQIAFHSMVNGNRDIFVMDPAGRDVQQVTTTKREDLAPQWIENGNGLIYFVAPDSVFVATKTGSGWSAPRFVAKAMTASSDGQGIVLGADPNQVCDTCAGGAYYMQNQSSKPSFLPLAEMPRVFSFAGTPVVSAINGAFVSIGERDGGQSIWRLPIGGAREERVFHFTDPHQKMFRTMVTASDSTNMYMILGDLQSDIWAMELKKQ
jgi:Tol biopolymer transport system component